MSIFSVNSTNAVIDGGAETGSLASELRVALTRVSRRLRAERGRAELPEGQFSVLLALAKHQQMTPGALADHEHVKPPSMTRAINILVEQGLVTKSNHVTDRRAVVVSLTERGIQEVEDTIERRNVWLTEQLDAMSDEDRAVISQAVALLTSIAHR